MRTPLERTDHYIDDVANYMSQLVDSYTACGATALPKPSRKVRLSSLYRKFNDVLCVDRFFLEGARVSHAMDAATRYAAGLVCPDISLQSALHALETVWLGLFWSLRSVQRDGSFRHAEFTDFLDDHRVTFRPVSFRRHYKNVLKSKHGVIRAICLRFTSANPSMAASLALQQAVRVNTMNGTVRA